MKKVYRAPEIVFENFSLNVSIASSCSLEANATKGNCGYQWSWDTVLFSIAIDECNAHFEETGENDQICYDIFNPAATLFAS